MARGKKGCMGYFAVFIVIVIVVLMLVIMPKGPEVPYDASVSDNHKVYFDVVSVSHLSSSMTTGTSHTRRSSYTYVNRTSEYSCVTSDGTTVRLVVSNNSSGGGKSHFDEASARGKRVHGVKVGKGNDAYVRFSSITPKD